jgi:hypothetical protein
MMDGNIANARLIAAAPDLLDALDRIRKDLQRMSDGYSADLDVMVDVARAAVAKATAARRRQLRREALSTCSGTYYWRGSPPDRGLSIAR